MRKNKTLLFAICFVICAGAIRAATLKDRDPTIFYPAGHYLEGMPRTLGTDIFGYNYQAHAFRGSFANVYLGGDGYPPYGGDTESYYLELVEEGLAATVEEAESLLRAMWYWTDRDMALVMKWNEAWLSNKDLGDDSGGTEPDGQLDRHYGYASYAGSGAWLTNHRAGSYPTEQNGQTIEAHWTYFIKIVTPPGTAIKVDGIWYTADGVEIGPERYGAFAAVHIIGNDPFGGIHGRLYGSPSGPGFGIYGPE